MKISSMRTGRFKELTARLCEILAYVACCISFHYIRGLPLDVVSLRPFQKKKTSNGMTLKSERI